MDKITFKKRYVKNYYVAGGKISYWCIYINGVRNKNFRIRHMGTKGRLKKYYILIFIEGFGEYKCDSFWSLLEAKKHILDLIYG